MIKKEGVTEFFGLLKSGRPSRTPSCQVVLGSGFGSALDAISGQGSSWEVLTEFSFSRIPGLAVSTVADHAGRYRTYLHKPTGKVILFQMGRIHGYEGHPARTVVTPVMLGRMAGIQNFFLTNAAGGIDPAHRVGDVMILSDHVNLTGQNPLCGANPTGLDETPLGPRFPDMTNAYQSAWTPGLRESLVRNSLRVHEGVYIGLLGPSFETPAEIRLFSKWGVQAVGMSTVWETIALTHSGAKVGALSLISNAAAGLGGGAPLEHEKLVETTRNAASHIVQGILSWAEEMFKTETFV